MQDNTLLKFWIGPVQSFVAAANSARDLWAGSYILAWLVRAAAKPIIDAGGEFIIPEISNHSLGDNSLRTPALPNHFTAGVPADKAEALAAACLEGAKSAWASLCEKVRNKLDPKAKQLEGGGDWDRHWNVQVKDYFDLRIVCLPPSVTNEVKRLGEINRLMAADKMIRRFPPELDEDQVPGKCSLLGDLEQMGPADLWLSRNFWKGFAKENFGSVARVRKGERLCAVSLVKRFAWDFYLAQEAGQQPDDLPMPDTPGMAAKLWLEKEGRTDLKRECKRRRSAAWLYWNKHNSDADEDQCGRIDGELLNKLDNTRRDDPPPTYYAIVHLDGDRMGDRIRNAEDIDKVRDISRQTARFATEQVQKIVNEHKGALIYGGGDDVLALLPAEAAVACASELRHRFGECLPGGTASAGIAFVHHKEDLRFAMEASRSAERQAKNEGRDRLVLSICRRSGEHSTASLRWTQCDLFKRLTDHFIHGASDRWAYILRAYADTLATAESAGSMPSDAIRGEVKRLLGRREGSPDGFVTDALSLFDDVWRPTVTETSRLLLYLALIQSASFLARGRDQ